MTPGPSGFSGCACGVHNGVSFGHQTYRALLVDLISGDMDQGHTDGRRLFHDRRQEYPRLCGLVSAIQTGIGKFYNDGRTRPAVHVQFASRDSPQPVIQPIGFAGIRKESRQPFRGSGMSVDLRRGERSRDKEGSQ